MKQHTVAWTHDTLSAPGVVHVSSEHLQGLLKTLMGHPDVDVIGIDGATWAYRETALTGQHQTWVVRRDHPLQQTG